MEAWTPMQYVRRHKSPGHIFATDNGRGMRFNRIDGGSDRTTLSYSQESHEAIRYPLTDPNYQCVCPVSAKTFVTQMVTVCPLFRLQCSVAPSFFLYSLPQSVRTRGLPVRRPSHFVAVGPCIGHCPRPHSDPPFASRTLGTGLLLCQCRF